MTREPARLALVIDHPTQQFARSAADRIHDAGCDRSAPWDFDLLGIQLESALGRPVRGEAYALAGRSIPSDTAAGRGVLSMGVADRASLYHLLPAGAHAYPPLR